MLNYAGVKQKLTADSNLASLMFFGVYFFLSFLCFTIVLTQQAIASGAFAHDSPKTALVCCLILGSFFLWLVHYSSGHSFMGAFLMKHRVIWVCKSLVDALLCFSVMLSPVPVTGDNMALKFELHRIVLVIFLLFGLWLIINGAYRILCMHRGRHHGQ